jgi:hypothetical protein
MDKDETYKIAVNTRQFEIQLFWQRSNYFLALNTAAAAGFFSLSLEKPGHAIALALFGLAVAVLWLCVNLGGKYWQVRWEAAADRLERDTAPEAKLFSASCEDVDREVRASVAKANHGRLRTPFDKLMLLKPSVSFAMTLLSLGFILLWLALVGVAACSIMR